MGPIVCKLTGEIGEAIQKNKGGGKKWRKRWSISLKLSDKNDRCTGYLSPEWQSGSNGGLKLLSLFVDFACEHAYKMPSLCALPGPDHVCARRSQSWHVDNSHQLYTTFSMSDDIPPLCPAEHEENRLLIIRSGAQRHVVDSFKINLQPRKDDTLLCSLCSRVEEKLFQSSQNVRQPVRTCLRLNVNMLRNKRTIRGYFAMQEVHKLIWTV